MTKTRSQLNDEEAKRAYDEFINKGGVVKVFASGERSDPETIKTAWGKPAAKSKNKK